MSFKSECRLTELPCPSIPSRYLRGRTGPFQTPWRMFFGLYWKRATRWGVLASMGCGLTSVLLWIGIGSPCGLHGFIHGILVSLLAMVHSRNDCRRSHGKSLEWTIAESLVGSGLAMWLISLYSAAFVGRRAVCRIVAVEVLKAPSTRSICLDESSSSKGGERVWRNAKLVP